MGLFPYLLLYLSFAELGKFFFRTALWFPLKEEEKNPPVFCLFLAVIITNCSD